jgi:hypothetical protein
MKFINNKYENSLKSGRKKRLFPIEISCPGQIKVAFNHASGQNEPAISRPSGERFCRKRNAKSKRE